MDHDDDYKMFLEITPPDHEFAGVMCDPNY